MSKDIAILEVDGLITIFLLSIPTVSTIFLSTEELYNLQLKKKIKKNAGFEKELINELVLD